MQHEPLFNSFLSAQMPAASNIRRINRAPLAALAPEVISEKIVKVYNSRLVFQSAYQA